MADDPPAVFDDENPEWTQAMFDRSRGPESLSSDVLAAFPNTRTRGPQKAARKRLVSLRLDPDVVEHFRETGAGWQSRINAVLRAAVDKKAG